MWRFISHIVLDALYVIVVGAVLALAAGLLVWLSWDVVGPGETTKLAILKGCFIATTSLTLVWNVYVNIRCMLVALRENSTFYDVYEDYADIGFKAWHSQDKITRTVRDKLDKLEPAGN